MDTVAHNVIGVNIAASTMLAIACSQTTVQTSALKYGDREPDLVPAITHNGIHPIRATLKQPKWHRPEWEHNRYLQSYAQPGQSATTELTSGLLRAELGTALIHVRCRCCRMWYNQSEWHCRLHK